MRHIIITVEDTEQEATILKWLELGEENGEIDFPFGAKCEEVAECT